MREPDGTRVRDRQHSRYANRESLVFRAAQKIILDRYETLDGKANPNRYVSMRVVRIPRILCYERIRSAIAIIAILGSRRSASRLEYRIMLPDPNRASVNRFSNITPKRLLQVDAAGALATAVTTGCLLAPQIIPTGLPAPILYSMAAAAGCFFLIGSATSILCSEYRTPLRWLAILNTAYCVTTIMLCISFSKSLTHWGWIYFPIETMIVGILVYFEWTVSRPAEEH
jgi:peptidoglycan/LPS O-acetylase OafA/YrhL